MTKRISPQEKKKDTIIALTICSICAILGIVANLWIAFGTNSPNEKTTEITASSGHIAASDDTNFEEKENTKEEEPIVEQKSVPMKPAFVESRGLILSMENSELLLEKNEANGVRFSIEATDDIPKEGILVYVPWFETACNQTLDNDNTNLVGVSHASVISTAGNPADAHAPENLDDTILLLKPKDKVTFACNVVADPSKTFPETNGILSVYGVSQLLGYK